jgi:sortase A
VTALTGPPPLLDPGTASTDVLPPPPPPPPRPPRVPASQRPLYVVSSVLTIIGVLALTFAVTVGGVGYARHARDQKTGFAQLRNTLANATTPVTQTDDTQKLYPTGTPIAVLDIPQIDLREVVFEGSASGVLMSGPGHRRDTPYPGQAGVSVIMGRQAAYGGPFRSLRDLKVGNVFNITTGQGKSTFRVVTVRRAGQYEPAPLADGKGRVTLMTAAGEPFVPQGVLRVDADLVTTVQPAAARPLGSANLPQPEKAMEGDPSVVVWILLLAQLLLLVATAITWARHRWGGWQVWLAGGPLLAAVAVALADTTAELLPNLM